MWNLLLEDPSRNLDRSSHDNEQDHLTDGESVMGKFKPRMVSKRAPRLIGKETFGS